MADVNNIKTIAFSIRADDYKIGNSTDVELPDIEYASDEDSGGGTLGSIDVPEPGQIQSMGLTINVKCTNEDYTRLMTAKKIDLRWVTDGFKKGSTDRVQTGNKIVASVLGKKFSMGKVANGEKQEASAEYECISYYHYYDGKELIAIDKLNSIFRINGVDQLSIINNLL